MGKPKCVPELRHNNVHINLLLMILFCNFRAKSSVRTSGQRRRRSCSSSWKSSRQNLPASEWPKSPVELLPNFPKCNFLLFSFQMFLTNINMMSQFWVICVCSPLMNLLKILTETFFKIFSLIMNKATLLIMYFSFYSRVVRKAIARVYIVMHQKQKENLRKLYKVHNFY